MPSLNVSAASLSHQSVIASARLLSFSASVGHPDMATVPWPEPDVEKLKSLWAVGYSASKISSALGGRYSRNAVLGKAHRLNLEMRDTATCRTFQARQVKPKTPKPPKHKAPMRVSYKLEIVDGTVARDIAPADHEPQPIGPLASFPDSWRACRWPSGEGATFRCCGASIKAGTPYCEYHAARAYNKPHGPRITTAPDKNTIRQRF